MLGSGDVSRNPIDACDFGFCWIGIAVSAGSNIVLTGVGWIKLFLIHVGAVRGVADDTSVALDARREGMRTPSLLIFTVSMEPERIRRNA